MSRVRLFSPLIGARDTSSPSRHMARGSVRGNITCRAHWLAAGVYAVAFIDIFSMLPLLIRLLRLIYLCPRHCRHCHACLIHFHHADGAVIGWLSPFSRLLLYCFRLASRCSRLSDYPMPAFHSASFILPPCHAAMQRMVSGGKAFEVLPRWYGAGRAPPTTLFIPSLFARWSSFRRLIFRHAHAAMSI